MIPGQILVGLSGPELTPVEAEWLRHPRVAGAILFDRNIQDWQQLRALTTAIHRQSTPAPLVAVDQEGGRVQRVQAPATRLPPARRLGQRFAADPDSAREQAGQMGWLMAAELRAAGVDWSLAPVLDLDHGASTVIGDRAFHGDPATVAALGAAWSHGMQAAGMPACGKHFPGHGGVTADSHESLPVDERSAGALRAADMVPFARVAADGLDAVMTAHVVYPGVDQRPATFSPVWLDAILRRELGFAGVVVGDDLGMAGAAGFGDYPERAQAAAEAGCDLLLLCNELTAVAPVLDALGSRVPSATRERVAALRPRVAAPETLERLQSTDTWRRAYAGVRGLCD